MSDDSSSDDSSQGTPRLDYELADLLNVETAAQLKALGDQLRLTIVDVVLERAMTVTELAERVGRPKGTVAHHVDVLVDAGLLQVVRTRKVRAVEERFYGRTARTFGFEHDDGEIPFLSDVVADIDIERIAKDRDDVASAFTFRHARIPRDRAEEYRERLYALSLDFIDEPRHGDVEYGLYLAMFPTNRLNPRTHDEDQP
jgi:DNA-binding transcriptional ArsR family regulator